MKLSTAIARFDTQLRADGKSERTRQAYLRDLRKVEGWLKKDVDVAAVTPDTLARFLVTQTGEGTKSPLSVNRTKTALKNRFQYSFHQNNFKLQFQRFIFYQHSRIRFKVFH